MVNDSWFKLWATGLVPKTWSGQNNPEQSDRQRPINADQLLDRFAIGETDFAQASLSRIKLTQANLKKLISPKQT